MGDFLSYGVQLFWSMSMSIARDGSICSIDIFRIVVRQNDTEPTGSSRINKNI